MAANNSQYKRRRDVSDSDDDCELLNDWPRFLVIQDADGTSSSLLKLSPFAIAKGVFALAGEPKMVRKMPYGLLIEVTKKSHAELLLKSTTFANLQVNIKVTPHRTLNTTKGVVRCRDLADLDEETIKCELADQKVTEVKRIYVEKGTKATNTYIITFNCTKLPTSVKVGYIHVKVHPYIPNPLRCFRCQEYGHGAGRCSRPERCARCGGNHAGTTCSAEPSCLHCHLRHETSDRNCPRFLLEKKIQQIKYMENVSFPEARKKAQSLSSSPSYASVTKRSTSTIGVQTDLSWPQGTNLPIQTNCSESVSTNTAYSFSAMTPPKHLQSSGKLPSNLAQDVLEGIISFLETDSPFAKQLKAAMRLDAINPQKSDHIVDRTSKNDPPQTKKPSPPTMASSSDKASPMDITPIPSTTSSKVNGSSDSHKNLAKSGATPMECSSKPPKLSKPTNFKGGGQLPNVNSSSIKLKK